MPSGILSSYRGMHSVYSLASPPKSRYRRFRDAKSNGLARDLREVRSARSLTRSLGAQAILRPEALERKRCRSEAKNPTPMIKRMLDLAATNPLPNGSTDQLARMSYAHS